MFKHAIALASLTAVALFAGQAIAASPATTTFQVKLNIEAACTVAASDVDFGTHDSSDRNIRSSSNIKVTCTKNTPYTIGLLPSNSDATGAGVMLRSGGASTNPADLVAYKLYSDSARQNAWGNSTGAGGNVVPDIGTGAATTHKVYAVASSANSAAGTYLDTVTVTVNY